MNNEWKDGLPPVGTECEAKLDGHTYERVTYHGHTKRRGDPILEFNDGIISTIPAVLRPIKSEAEKLREELDEAIKLNSVLRGGDSYVLASNLFKQGCRITRELPPEVVSKLWIDYKGPHSFAKAIAAYVRGELEL